MCHVVLHNNHNCVVNYKNKILCKGCFKKGLDDSRFFEEQAEEQWMGKNVPPKKRLRFSYLEPDNEVLMLDFSKKHRSVAIGLLRNGHLVHTKPIKIGANYITLQNTCSFDSITQLLGVAYCDSEAFKRKIDEIKENNLCELVKKLVKNGVIGAYNIRAKILFNTFDHVTLPENILCVHAEGAMFNTITKIFGDIYMGTCIYSCQTCQYNSIERIHYISVEVSNINNLSENVASFFHCEIKRTRCLECPSGLVTKQIVLDSFFLIIEPVNIPSLNLELEISLDSIPKYMSICETKFILRGICAYQGEPDPNHLGHFLAYGYRHNDKWIMYNDLLKKPEAVSPKQRVRCILFFYSI